MKLGSKIVLLFGLGFAVIVAFHALDLPRVVASVTETRLKALARTVGGYLVYDLSNLPFGGDAKVFEKTIDRRFEFVAALGVRVTRPEVGGTVGGRISVVPRLYCITVWIFGNAFVQVDAERNRQSV